MTYPIYPIGTPGTPWTAGQKQQWLEHQQIKRSYHQQVVSRFRELESSFARIQYGRLPIDPVKYPLYGLKSRNWQPNKPNVMITGGVHGYETSGVQGAIRFLESAVKDYANRFNFVVAPCVSPWGYETINRWNPAAIDPNRSFFADSPAPESLQLMQWVKSLNIPFIAHFDLHETTDTDNSEFRPALASRDGTTHDNWNIPDGFYGVGNTDKPVPDFQKAIIASVEKVTHIAPADENGLIIGAKLEQHGVINYAYTELGLCGGLTGADFVTTTEVYPDSPKVDDENCVHAQVAAIAGGLDYILNNAL